MRQPSLGKDSIGNTPSWEISGSQLTRNSNPIRILNYQIIPGWGVHKAPYWTYPVVYHKHANGNWFASTACKVQRLAWCCEEKMPQEVLDVISLLI